MSQGGGVQRHGDAEIDNHNPSGRHEDIGRLQIPVNHSGTVDGNERLGDPAQNPKPR
jgi:hypothetical protein